MEGFDTPYKRLLLELIWNHGKLTYLEMVEHTELVNEYANQLTSLQSKINQEIKEPYREKILKCIISENDIGLSAGIVVNHEKLMDVWTKIEEFKDIQEKLKASSLIVENAREQLNVLCEKHGIDISSEKSIEACILMLHTEMVKYSNMKIEESKYRRHMKTCGEGLVRALFNLTQAHSGSGYTIYYMAIVGETTELTADMFTSFKYYDMAVICMNGLTEKHKKLKDLQQKMIKSEDQAAVLYTRLLKLLRYNGENVSANYMMYAEEINLMSCILKLAR